MVDEIFGHPRLAAIYDVLDADRSDLETYAAIAAEFHARRVLDVGCGTGTFALLLADRGLEVVGVDPATAMLDVGRAKPGAERVTWIQGDASRLPADLQVDLATMTGNVAQAIVSPREWEGTLLAVHKALRPSGRLVFETRIPARRGWEEWDRRSTERTVGIAGVGPVQVWSEITAVEGDLVSFRYTWKFAADGATLTSDSTLRFRERDHVEADLRATGYVVEEVREAPDRPGREYVFVARRPS